MSRSGLDRFGLIACKHRWAAAALLIALPSLASGLKAQDESPGLRIAQRVCGECHAVGKAATVSPHPQVPTFVAIANSPGRTETSLRVWLQSPHRSMPDFTLSDEESTALVTYILSLKKRTGR